MISASETAAKIAAGELTAAAAVDAVLGRIAAHDGAIGAYLALDPGAREAAAAIDRKRAAGDAQGPLAGVPIALKDNLVTRGVATTAASKILAGWVPPYDATVVEKLRAAGAIVVGKLNCDEFAMGSSTENSAVKPTRNPWDISRVPGGSSGGSAAAVAAGLCAGALGTDTGGSIRQPAAFCGVVGVKPTYGRVSRWGVIAFASSLDQVGPLARTVEDAALILEVIAGLDPRDETSIDAPVPRYRDALTGDVKDLRVGIPREYFDGELASPGAAGARSGADGRRGDLIDADVRAALERTKAQLVERGAVLVDVSLPHTKYALPAYYLVAPAEASSNLARYDGIRFGAAASGAATLEELYTRARAAFGPEVKRRIMLGTFALRSGYYDAYYKKAQQVRTLVKRDFDEAFAAVDVVLTPTTPTPAFAFGAKATPLEMYRADVFTLACNLAGLPGISVPCGLSQSGLPIGAQLLGKPLDEATLFRAAGVIEAAAAIGGPKAFA